MKKIVSVIVKLIQNQNTVESYIKTTFGTVQKWS